MTDNTPPIDLQDPLPESNWVWRRVFVFAVTAAVLWMTWKGIDRLGAVAMVEPTRGVPALLSLCKSLLFLTMLMATYYMVAPSAEQIVKMMKTAALLRSGVQVAGKRTEETAESRTEVAKTVGLPPAPPIPGTGETIPTSEAATPASEDEGPPWAGHKENK